MELGQKEDKQQDAKERWKKAIRTTSLQVSTVKAFQAPSTLEMPLARSSDAQLPNEESSEIHSKASIFSGRRKDHSLITVANPVKIRAALEREAVNRNFIRSNGGLQNPK